MRIVIDFQGAQSESRFRGIGRYTTSIVKALIRNKNPEDEIILALNGVLKDTVESIRAEFYDLLPQENIRVWYMPYPVREAEKGNDYRREAAEKIREAFLYSLKPDIILIPSLFEGFVDDVVTSIGAFDDKIPVAIIAHDLIPYKEPQVYFENPLYKEHYLKKIEYFKKASLYLTNSHYTAKDIIDTLKLDKDKVVNISAAVEEFFKKIDISAKEKEEILKRFGIQKDFIMFTGAFDSRKNVKGLINAFSILPSHLRQMHQLVFVGKIQKGDIEELSSFAKKLGLNANNLLFTGYVSDDELVKLYNLCKLFVFPSFGEGFGFPPLEAMSCGAPVVASNRTSIPEVIGREDILFDPYKVEDIKVKIERVLINDQFREELREYGLKRAKEFSWDKSAEKTLDALRRFAKLPDTKVFPTNHMKKLAYLSPLPPEKSGISDYSKELLPELSKFYDIEIIINQEEISDEYIKKHFQIKDVEYFRKNFYKYDRVLYHFGNSPFHTHMFDLIEDYPGVVVLHDFFLSSVIAYLELNNIKPNMWAKELFYSHGYKALEERLNSNDIKGVVFRYPCNLRFLENAIGVIVHSNYSKLLAKNFYGESVSKSWTVIPQLIDHNIEKDRTAARKKLSFEEDDFVVCSFGILDITKLNHRVLDAWLNSSLSKNKNCYLIFVGENHGGDYGKALLNKINESPFKDRVKITGWIDTETFKDYLSAADLAIQLRTLSRGETSRAMLECMNYGIPTIVNAHGSMAELPKDAVYMIKDEFEDEELIKAIEELYQNPDKRLSLGEKAREEILKNHSPAFCAEKYYEAIEKYYKKEPFYIKKLVDSIASINTKTSTSDIDILNIAKSIDQTFLKSPKKHTIFLDMTETIKIDLKTGIQRVARAILINLIKNAPPGYYIEPVYLSNHGGFWHYKAARSYMRKVFSYQDDSLEDEVIEPDYKDIILTLDITSELPEAKKSGLFDYFMNKGVRVYSIVHDILPIKFPQFFPPSGNVWFEEWLRSVCSFNGAICISKSVAEDLKEWFEKANIKRLLPFKITYNHNGSDLENSIPTKGMPEDASEVLSKISSKISFLMVGTIEPRKGHLQTIKAFEILWNKGYDINLVIVGKEGWTDLDDSKRRTIPLIVNTIKTHPELNKRLFWLQGISDEYLEKVYSSSKCLIMASEAEGFGLPLIEAAKHKIPIITRDIPVFKEIAKEYAYYFENSLDPQAIAKAVEDWLILYKDNKHPKSDNMPHLTWKESSMRLLDIILNDKFEYIISPKA